jgi:hypothetical protein
MLSLLLSCVSPCLARFDPEPFQSDQVHVVVGIDLTDESAISMGVVIRDNESHEPKSARIVLPFPSTKAGGNDQILSTWGSYEKATYISLILPGTGVSYYPIELTPVIHRSDGDLSTSDFPIVFAEDGQARTFIYRYPPEKPVEGSVAFFARSGALPVDAVAVLLPQDARPLEVRPGKTSDPPDIFYKGHVGFYPATRQGVSDRLEIRYWLPATESQKALVEFLTKFFALIAAPLATIIVTRVTGRVAGMRRYLVIVVGVSVQCIVLVLIGTFWFRWSGATSTSNLIDVGIGIIGAVISVVVWWISD